MNEDIALKVHGIYKSFRLPHEQHSGIKQLIVNVFNRKRGYETQQVLDDINFEVKKGEFFGIVGRNGSGKSTLLKLIAGIYSPDSGAVAVNGTLTPFIELGVGFNPELTGRENVFLNGALLGFNRTEMEMMYDDIVSFAELERFMDQKLKNYSSGMQVRLAFSIAIRAEGDILVLDEVLAVGDEAFQQKCFDYFEKLKNDKKTVILVTHDMESAKRYCDRVLLLDKGKVSAIGSAEKGAYLYKVLNTGGEYKADSLEEWGSRDVQITNVYLSGNKQKNIVHPGDNFSFCVDITNNQNSDVGINFSLAVMSGGTKCFDISTYYSSPMLIEAQAKGTVEVEFKDFRLLPGTYTCNISIFNETMKETFHGLREAFTINVLGEAKELGATGIVMTSSTIKRSK